MAHPDLGSSFGRAATAYAAYRPGYALDAVRWALAVAPGTQVLDLGAGTGKLTAALLALGADVVAVEPDVAMLRELRTALPEVTAHLGSAEHIPLPHASVDAVLAGHALHWFDLDVAGPEITRVLRPGGVLAGLWNIVDDAVPWVAELASVAGAAALGSRDLRSTWLEAVPTAELGEPEHAYFPHPLTYTADSLVARIATHAGILVLPDDERRTTLDRIRAYLAQTPQTAEGEFTLPMLTAVLRVVAG